MESSCVRQNLIPGTSKLLGDYLYHYDRVQQFFPGQFQDADALAGSAKKLDFPADRRAAIVTALREQNGNTPALAKLAQPGTVAVVTGQQVGLFSGPAYTVYKALTAIKLVEQLESEGVAAVPVFWVATEDHDLAEVDHAWVFDHQATPTKIALRSDLSNPGPVGRVQLQDIPIEALRTALGDLPFADEVTEIVAQAYRPGVSLGQAFVALVRHIFHNFDLLYLDPLFPAIRAIAAPFLADVVDRVPTLTAALQRRDKELAAAGYHSQVHIEPDTSLVFLLDEGRRVPLRFKDGQFTAKDRSYTQSELRAAGDRISPNALLRPVMQDYLLPTVSYVGGPAEIAYMAQAEVIYRELLGRMPIIFPRNGFTLLDSRTDKLLNRYTLRILDLWEGSESVKTRIAERLVPSELSHEIGALQQKVASTMLRLKNSLVDFDPTLAKAAKKSAEKISFQFEKVAQKTARESLRRDTRAGAEAAYLSDLVFPHQHLQERFFSIIPFLAKHGLDLPERIADEVQLTCADHMIRVF